MTTRIRASLLALPLLLPSFQAIAALPGMNLGQTSFLDGKALPGTLFQQFVNIYEADDFMDANGHRRPLDNRLRTLLATSHFAHISQHQLFGAYYGAEILVPVLLADPDFEPHAGSANGLGNLIVSPFILQWPQTELFGRPYWQRLNLAFQLPTGRYDRHRAINPGSNHWSFNPHYALTWEFAEGWEASARLQYLLPGKNRDPAPPLADDYLQPGQAFHANYSVSLMAGGGTAAVLSPRIAEHFSNWQAGLGAWAVPALLALLLWMFARPREVLPSAGEGPVRHFFGNRRGWLLAVYFGLINGGYTSMVAWLPVYYRQLGWSAQDSGGLVGIMTIFQVLAALSVPLLIRRRLDRRPWLLAALLVQLGGFCGLLLMPLQHAALWVALIGYGLGACFALSLTLTLDHLHEPRAAGSLAAFVQGIGFIITGIVPYLTGWLRDVTGSFQASWLLLAASVVAMLLVTLRFAPSGYARAMGETRD